MITVASLEGRSQVQKDRRVSVLGQPRGCLLRRLYAVAAVSLGYARVGLSVGAGFWERINFSDHSSYLAHAIDLGRGQL